MGAYIARRLSSGLLVAVLLSAVLFLLLDTLPGDPAVAQLGINANPSALDSFRELHGLDRPLVVRYLDWMSDILRGDLGTSLASRHSVASLIEGRLAPTLQLGMLSLLLAIMIGVPAGILAALHRNSAVDVMANAGAVFGVALPNFFLGLLLILVFSVYLGLLPASGYVPFTADPIENMKHMILPVLTLGTSSSAILMRYTRSAMLDVINKDYIRTARAKGLPATAVMLRHGLRNAMIPILTIFGFEVSVIFGGAVVTESIFNIPGMGRLLLDSVRTSRDYTTIQSLAFLAAMLMILVNLVIDLCYAVIDPRIRYE